MNGRYARPALALIGAAAALAFMAWFDAEVIRSAERRAMSEFRSAEIQGLLGVGYVLTAGAVLLVGALAWAARSAIVGVAYAVVGAFFAFLPAIVWDLGAGRNDTPAFLPDPIARPLGDLLGTVQGPLGAVFVIGGGMLVAGIGSVVLALRSRRAAHGAAADATGRGVTPSPQGA